MNIHQSMATQPKFSSVRIKEEARKEISKTMIGRGFLSNLDALKGKPNDVNVSQGENAQFQMLEDRLFTSLGIDLEIKASSSDEFLYEVDFKLARELNPKAQKVITQAGPLKMNLSVLPMLVSTYDTVIQRLATAVEELSVN